MDLNSLVEAATGASDTEARKQAVRDALAAGENPSLPDLEHAAASAFAEIATPKDSGYSDTDIQQMAVLADVVDVIRAEFAARAESEARIAELTERIGTPTLTVPAQETSEAADAPAPEPVAEAPAEQPAEPEPGAEAIETPAEPEKELVLASGQKRPVARIESQVPLAQLPKQLPAIRETGSTHPFTITAAADVPGHNLGTELDIAGLTNATMARFQQLARGGGDFGGSRSGIASINIERPREFVAENQHDWQTIEYACDERRLPGGSLLASAAIDPMAAPESTPGWCAPCTPTHDFCPIAVVDGTIDLPQISAPRGCISWPVSPQFHEIYSGTGWCFTPEQIDNMQSANPDPAIGPDSKPCYKIPCPPNADMVLEPCGLCIQASILHERAYPELIQYTVQQALVAHAHKMNCRVLCSMESQSVRVTMPPEGAGAGAAGSNFGPGATAYTLEAIELQVEWLRYRHRLGMDTTIEMVAPAWMRGILRADLSKRMGVDMLSVTNQMLVSYMALRGVRTQFVLDWQDAFCTDEVAGDPQRPVTIPESARFGGGDSPQTAWPEKATVLLYPAGTFFMARMDIINLEGGLLDSTLLRKNERIVLFTEEAMAVGKRCYESLAVEIPLCPSGQTGSGAWTQCAPAPKAPAAG